MKRPRTGEGTTWLDCVPGPVPNKFKAIRTIIDNITFASKREAKRYGELKLLLRAGEIGNLELQVPFEYPVNGAKVFTYIADFVYFDGNRRVIEDVKGVRTPVYRLKKKLIEAHYNVEIREV